MKVLVVLTLHLNKIFPKQKKIIRTQLMSTIVAPIKVHTNFAGYWINSMVYTVRTPRIATAGSPFNIKNKRYIPIFLVEMISQFHYFLFCNFVIKLSGPHLFLVFFCFYIDSHHIRHKCLSIVISKHTINHKILEFNSDSSISF